MQTLNIKSPSGEIGYFDQSEIIRESREALRKTFPTLVDQASDEDVLRAATTLIRSRGGDIRRTADEDYIEIDGQKVPKSQLQAMIKAQIRVETAKAVTRLTGRID